MVSPIQTKPKAIDKKKNLNGVCDFWRSGACCRCSYAIHKSCTLIKGHTQARRRRISLCVGVHCRNCCRCCGSSMWLIVCQKDCPFKIAIRRACWQVILARPSSSSPAVCVAREGLGSQPERLTRRPALSQLSHSCQRAINAIYSFIFANLRRRHVVDSGKGKGTRHVLQTWTSNS